MIPELPPDLCTAAIPAPAATERLCVQPSRTELPSSPSRSAILRPQPPGRSPRCAQLSPARPGPARQALPGEAREEGNHSGRRFPEAAPAATSPPGPARPSRKKGKARTCRRHRPGQRQQEQPQPQPRQGPGQPPRAHAVAPAPPQTARRERGEGGPCRRGRPRVRRGAGLAACWAASALVPLWPGWCVRGEAAVGRARPELRGEQHSAARMPS